jgi:hypothetical protein
VAETFNFTWGLPELDGLGYVQVFEFMLDHYAELGVTRQEMLCVIHLARYHFNTPDGESRPALETVATQMGYGHKSRVSDLVRSLEEKGMLLIGRSPGSPSVYNAAPFARRCFELWLAGVAEKRNPKTVRVAENRNGGVAENRNRSRSREEEQPGVVADLLAFGVDGAIAKVREFGPERCAEVLAYAEKHGLGPGWIVSRLKSGEPLPCEPDEQDWRRFVSGEYADYIEY